MRSPVSNASYCVFRWESFCKPGMWLVNISSALGERDREWHLHAHCVVDDFGDLQPIEFVGLTAQRRAVHEARGAGWREVREQEAAE